MYAQLIDDNKSITIVSANVKEIKVGKKTQKKDVSFELGKLIATKALEKKITKAVFDRGGYKYHGRVKSLADGAREGGLNF
jgi:large subunit ribosomal protein L18